MLVQAIFFRHYYANLYHMVNKTLFNVLAVQKITMLLYVAPLKLAYYFTSKIYRLNSFPVDYTAI